jgi:hypothetical protein
MNVSLDTQTPGIHFQSKKWYGEQKTHLLTISVFSRNLGPFPLTVESFPLLFVFKAATPVIVWLMPRHEGTQSVGAHYPYNTLNVPS